MLINNAHLQELFFRAITAKIGGYYCAGVKPKGANIFRSAAFIELQRKKNVGCFDCP